MHSGVKRAVLVGAGHAHLYTLKRANEFVQRGYELVPIAPGPVWYSGLATGMLGGAYPAALDQVDVAALVTRNGGRFIEDEICSLDLPNRVVLLNRGAPVPFDVLSVAIREAPVIFHNLLAALADAPLRSFEPQRKFLSIMALGAGQGLAVRGSLWWRGRAAFWLKDRIGRKFMCEFQGAAGQEFVAV